MKRLFGASFLLFGMTLWSHSAESDAVFAQRLQQHLTGVTRDIRVLQVAQEASPSNVTVEFQLDAEGRVGKPKIVHSILSRDAQGAIIAALTDLPPMALNGYVPGATFRLPLRLEFVAPVKPAPTAQ